MKTITQSGEGTQKSEKPTQFVQVVLPTRLARQAKAAAAEDGVPLREVVEKALEQYLERRRAA